MKKMVRIIKLLLAGLSGMVLLILLILFSPGIWRHFVTYPELDNQVDEFKKLRKETPEITKLNTYRGVMHVHSYWSHDSEGTLHELISAAKHTGIDFIFLTDHPRSNTEVFPRGYSGFHDGVLIEPGSEKKGFAAWPLDSAVIDWRLDEDSIIEHIVSAGGLLFYAHTEEPHNWNNPLYQGMEIYNFHTDTKDERLLPHLANFVVNGKKYRHWALREMFDEQTPILELWDSLNTQRKIVGFSAVDTHENQNIRARYLDDGRVEWVGPNANPFDTANVHFLNRWLFHEPDPGGWIFKWMIDTYKEGFDYITNYVLADTLTTTSLAQHVKAGHLFTAFKSLGDAKGFLYWCEDENSTLKGIMGDSITLRDAASLRAVSPLPGKFVLIHNGKTVHASPNDVCEFAWKGPFSKGAYRIEMHIKIKDKIVPWLYSNPVYIY